MRKREKERIWKIRRLKGTPAALIGLVNAPDEAKPNESGEPAAEAGELIRRQLGNSRSDFFDFHVLQYSTPSRACGATDVPRTLTREYPAIVRFCVVLPGRSLDRPHVGAPHVHRGLSLSLPRRRSRTSSATPPEM